MIIERNIANNDCKKIEICNNKWEKGANRVILQCTSNFQLVAVFRPKSVATQWVGGLNLVFG